MIDLESFLSRAAGTTTESAIRKMGAVLAGAADVVSFAPGYPSVESFAWDDFRAIAGDLLASRRESVLQYGATRGYRPLLEVIAGLMADRGVATSHDRLLITHGSQQGLDVIARLLLDPGDVVLVELPSYTGAISAFRAVGADLAGVPQQADGYDLEALDSTLANVRAAGRRVKCVYTVPNFQNPTGLLVSARKRQALLTWAARHNLLIIEDDPYCDLYFPDLSGPADTRPIAADDTDGRVIYLSSFSKTLAPGFRVAWLHAAPALIAKLEVAKQAADLCNGSFGQQLVNEACRRGVLARQLPRLRTHYQSQRDVLVRALSDTLGESLTWTMPRGGFFLWARLPGPVDGDTLLPHAIARGVVFVAGSAFFVSGQERQFVRLSFSSPTPERIQEGARRLRLALSDALAGPSTSGPVPLAHPRQSSR